MVSKNAKYDVKTLQAKCICGLHLQSVYRNGIRITICPQHGNREQREKYIRELLKVEVKWK